MKTRLYPNDPSLKSWDVEAAGRERGHINTTYELEELLDFKRKGNQLIIRQFLAIMEDGYEAIRADGTWDHFGLLPHAIGFIAYGRDGLYERVYEDGLLLPSMKFKMYNTKSRIR